MDGEKNQFDASIGGTEKLPHAVTLSTFASYRCQEIQVMRNSLAAQSGTKLAFQSIPKHMRRRAGSHNVKRLPRRLRQIHLNQMKKSGMPVKPKRPSRNYRRKPRNLLEEYTKRATKNYRWLQTHIWHAKRFHMIEKWGYKIPCHPREKAFRACYRAVAKHCLLQDISYFNCIEISGDKNLIITNINKMHESNTGLSFAAKAFIDGKREGELTLFSYGTLDRRAFGIINFLWQPPSNNTSKLWLWVHAAFYDDILDNLKLCFNLNQDCDNMEGLYNSNERSINIMELKNELSRFRLTGPLANSIIHDAFEILNINSYNSISWINEYLKSTNNKEALEEQIKFWENTRNISSASQISPHTVFSIIVKDPRLNLPNKVTKSIPDEIQQSIDAPNNISPSPLWNNRIKLQKLPCSKISEFRSNLLVPGTEIDFVQCYVPIILIQKPGSQKENIGFCSGWDIIIPSIWAKPFWVSLIMRGARAGGLRESNSIAFEMGKSQFLYPDTFAGAKEEEQTSQERINEFFRKPPNRRTNYNKFNITSPFKCNWNLLIQEWRTDPVDSVNDFFVLRDKYLLRDFENLINGKTNLIPKYPQNCLIPVRVICEQKGSLKPCSLICLMKTKNDAKIAVAEVTCIDNNEIERKKTREAHKTSLKKLKRRRKLRPNIAKDAENHDKVLREYTKKMRSLWLPETVKIRNSCIREVIGFVTKGQFSFSVGKSCGTGFITADAVLALIKSPCRNKVLVRSTNNRNYRRAKLSVICEP